MSGHNSSRNKQLVQYEKDARLAEQAGNLDQAIALLNQLVDLQPDYEHGAPYYQLALLQQAKGDNLSARRCYEYAISYEPSNPIFLSGFAEFLMINSAPEEALPFLHEFVRRMEVLGLKPEVEQAQEMIRIMKAKKSEG